MKEKRAAKPSYPLFGYLYMNGRHSSEHARNSPWSWQRLGFFVVLAGFIDVLLVLAGASPRFAVLLAPLFGVMVLTVVGEWLLALAGSTAEVSLPAAFVAGAAAMMMAVLAVICLFGVTAQTAFLACSLCVVLIQLAWPAARRTVGKASLQDTLATLVLAVLVAYFCRGMATFLPTASAGGTLPIWIDYYVHATVIASFGDPLAIKQGNILLAHVPRPFYHYGAFMLPAALLPVSGLPGMGLAMANLLPLGLLIGALGLYALFAQLTSRATALLAVLCIACLPDPSRYGMQNGFYDFRWLLYTAPGSGYALGVGALACSCLLQGLRTKNWRFDALGLLLLLSLFMIRLHFFVLLAPAFVGTWLLARWQPPLRRKALVAGTGLALVIMAVIILLAAQPSLRAMLQSFTYVQDALGFGPATYLRYFKHVESSMPVVAPLALLVLMLLAAALGAFLVVLPLVTLARARSGRWEDFDWLPWLLCTTYALLTLAAPTGLNTDASELKHRHFILLYAMVGGWSIACGLQWLSERMRRGRVTEYAWWLASAGVLMASMTWARDSNPAQPSLDHMPWARSFFGVPVAPGIVQTGAYIRSHSDRGDLMAMTGAAMRGYMQSRQTELIGFADVATYLGRSELLEKQGGAASALASQRGAEIDRMSMATSWGSACQRLNAMGVRWYVENQPELPRWDPSHSAAVYRAGDFVVYDAGSTSRSRCNAAVP